MCRFVQETGASVYCTPTKLIIYISESSWRDRLREVLRFMRLDN